ncbi:hypothetical protein JB92DRAFT_2825249 [Gautieria morchelliformis]|nr:hypothetical protein JB92DRAFT_2825249 [Gautieria morchelliformis]
MTPERHDAWVMQTPNTRHSFHKSIRSSHPPVVLSKRVFGDGRRVSELWEGDWTAGERRYTESDDGRAVSNAIMADHRYFPPMVGCTVWTFPTMLCTWLPIIFGSSEYASAKLTRLCQQFHTTP